MLLPDTSLFLWAPGESAESVLQPAAVLRVAGDRCIVELKDAESPFESGMDVLLYRQIRRAYMQQAAHVQRVHAARKRLLLQTRGEPVSAEGRDCYRVSTVTVDIHAKLGTEEGCRVLDLSATGLSILAVARHATGSQVEAALRHEGEEHQGSVLILSARPWRGKRIRYGVCSLDDPRPGASLETALPGINLAIQRQYLQRLAGHR